MLNKKIKHISNLIIVSLILIVSLFSFLPERAITISSGESYRAIYNGDRDSKYVSLMINVYENGEVVKEMLDLFKEEGVVATFFVGGCWADDNCEILKRIINEGHELGNHGYFHKDHKKLSENSNYNEIYNCDKIVSSLTGYKMTLFAPPSGAYSVATVDAATSLNYKTIMWTRDTID
ncbi:MAG: polysaccharide deacetylase family protein, partial [Clostridia bacterium]|nr:polysaccharide deacetylase family protein [Clostridia bacterium]